MEDGGVAERSFAPTGRATAIRIRLFWQTVQMMFCPIYDGMFLLDSELAIPEVNMPVVSRGALLVATASMAACVLAGPGAAYAASTSTSLTAAEMSAELTAVGKASAKAAEGGWKTSIQVTTDGFQASGYLVVDPVHGVALDRFNFDGFVRARYTVAGKGTYDLIADRETRAAVKMMHRPSVQYVFSPDNSVELNDTYDFGSAAPGLLDDDLDYPGTKTVHDDGSIDYQLSEDDATVTLHVTVDGLLASADAVTQTSTDAKELLASAHDEGLLASAGTDGGTYRVRFGYGYGPQRVTLPSASATIGADTLRVGLAYLDMANAVKRVAGDAATDTLQAAHGKRVTVSLLRKVTRADVTEDNADLGVKMIKTKSVSRGIRVYATNPWTHRTAAYTLKASGKKVTIAQK
ncbi:hypothetical protein [Actinoplanes regularis]|nr:hypothetical protein [Actinoplanes regularis]GIE92020.1 hypothetical protein Are01nite_85000 [Actinoplanes regularis]